MGFRDERCEDERSFLLELLTDRQLNEFIEYINEEYGEDDDGEYTYSAETLKKQCCCGATNNESWCTVCLKALWIVVLLNQSVLV